MFVFQAMSNRGRGGGGGGGRGRGGDGRGRGGGRGRGRGGGGARGNRGSNQSLNNDLYGSNTSLNGAGILGGGPQVKHLISFLLIAPKIENSL